MTPHRFPAPWTADKIPGGYVVRDGSGQALAYVYCRANEAEAMQAKVLTEHEARRVAVRPPRAVVAPGTPKPVTSGSGRPGQQPEL
jgi:hypothetical protein